ncbi:amidohydrolase [Ornithinibacillus sp. 4-3]|uniref:Amidohydrolase n=1 Tax=Ornithinibacillus sp. 4-3 TaxID=3231488 RepID=A0AB39HHP9_9BACI
MNTTYWLTNTRLETSYYKENDMITATNTEFFHLLIEDGKITDIVPASEQLTDELPKKDAKQLLALPSFVEKHCHLDKTLLGDQWRAVKPVKNILERVVIEKTTLPTLKTTTQERAENLLGRFVKYGVTHVRTHADIYPEVGLENLEEIKKAFQTFSGKIEPEIVGFAQHGFLKANTRELIQESTKHGVDYIGSVDPATVDNDIETSLQVLVDIAVEGNVGIDLHIHDPNELGAFTIKRLAELTIEAGLQGKVAVSHAFGIGDISRTALDEMIPLLKEAGMTFISSVPIDRKFPPLEYLREQGINTAVCCDNIFDSWSPFNNGDILERLERLAQLKQWKDEYSLSQSIYFITGGITPLNQLGEQVWPKVGDAANIVLVDATCTAETVARRAERKATIYKGNFSFDNI